MSIPPNDLATLTAARNRSAGQPILSRRTQRRLFRLALLTSDGLMLALAFALAYWVRFRLQVALSPEITPSPQFYVRLMAALLPLWLGLFALFRLYDFQHLLGGTAEYARIFNACTSGMMLVVTAAFLLPSFFVARGWVTTSWLLSILLVCGARFWLRRVAYAFRTRGYFLAPAIIVGANSEALNLAEQLSDERGSGLRLIGFVASSRPAEAAGQPELPLLGALDSVEAVVKQYAVEEVVVATTALDRGQLLNLFDQLSALPGVEMRLSSGLFEVLTTGVQVRRMGPVPLMSLDRLRLDPIELAAKTILDYTVALLSLLAALPLFLAIVLLIKLTSPGPVFHRRQVLGVGGKQFYALKFRTMFVDGDQILARQPQALARLRADHKLKHDPRVTSVGRWLRRYSLDELPQLLNVLLGQMSMVGPRMISPQEAERYGRFQANLLTVKPGITGLWQVSGRSDLSYEERVRLDMHYIRHYTIWRDLQILFIQTPPAVLKGRGAY